MAALMGLLAEKYEKVSKNLQPINPKIAQENKVKAQNATKYINLNLKRTGHLFEYAFKAKMITDESTFLHVHRYIHMNPVMAHLVEYPSQWRWSSYQEFCNSEIHPLCDHKEILDLFPSLEKYQAFIESVDDLKQLAYRATLQKDQDEDSIFL